MPARWGTSAGVPRTSTPPSRSAARWCAGTGSWCRLAPGSWPTRIRHASSGRPRTRRRPCSRRWRSPRPGGEVYLAPVFKLLSTTGEQSIDLQPGRNIVVGRAVTSDVPIYDPTISRRHAEVSLTDGGVKVKDAGSSNGTFLNGARITGAKPAGGTIVRQLPVSVSGGVPAIVTAAPSGASHLKVSAKSLEELREKKLELLLEISKELSKQQELDRLLDKVVEFTFQVMNVDRVSILLLEAATGELVPRISRGRTAQSSASKHVPQSSAVKVGEDRVAMLSDKTAAAERFQGKSILIQRVRSALCTPLMGTPQKVLGILYVDNLTATHSFSDD